MNETLYDNITQIQKEIKDKREAIAALRAPLQPEPVSDYKLKNWEVGEVMLSSLFDERGELMVIHNMGKRCTYCTLWADGFNGFALPLANRAPFVVVSPDAPEVQKAFAESRGWKFNMLSAEGTAFIADLGFEPEPGTYWPGVSTFKMEGGKIYRVAKDTFGPGDDYCSIWHLFNLLPNKENAWQPKYNYV